MMKPLLTFSLLFLLFFLTACSTTSSPPSDVSGTNDIQYANELLQKGKKKEAAKAYFLASKNHPSPAKERLILQAAEIAFAIRNRAQVMYYLKQVRDVKLLYANRARYSYIQALVALLDNKPKQALKLLPTNTRGLSNGLARKILQARKKALAKLGKTKSVKPRRVVAHSHSQFPSTIKQVAVLLPLTGQLGTVSKNILQGIKDSQLSFASNIKIKSYDTANKRVVAQYKKAVAEGADLIIGPLNKINLAALAAQGKLLTKPIISLNALVDNRYRPTNLYQFGLLPEDEAEQIADFAIAKNQKNAIVLAPNSRWGHRVSKAFIKQYTSKGGRILKIERYANQPRSYIRSVKKALTVGKNKIDMVFLAASPTQARLIRPTLHYHNASHIPVYATSHIFSGKTNAAKNDDLNGIVYTEIPFVLNATQLAMTREGSIPRLYALGMDALLIAKNIHNMVQQSNKVLNGKTGRISLDQHHKFHRKLRWATFVNGLSKPYND